MRKFLIAMLLAGAAASPALASPHDDSEQAREDRAQAREERQQARQQSHSDRSNNAETQSSARPDSPAVQQQSFDRQGRIQDLDAARAVRRDSIDEARTLRIDQRQQNLDQIRESRELRQSTRPLPHVMQTRVPVVSNVPRPGTQPPLRTEVRQNSQPHWSTNWRNNSKYDWHHYRNHHRSLFHIGFYFDPFGWGYNPYQIGWRLWPSYYSSNYWINDPWEYRLPYAPPGTRWIRYYDDAVLVDMWSGQVVDVIYDFFW